MHLASYLSDAFLPSTHPSHPVSKLLQMVDELSPDYSSQLVSFRADPVTSTIRHILESSYEWHEDRLEELLDVARVDASSLSAVQTDIETSLESTAADLFLSSFNPATSGMRMLLSERLDQMVIRPSVSQNRVSVHLGRCRQWMREFANSNLLSFPALLESVFNSIGNDGRIPLVVDTGASCCISPCPGDFVEYTSDTKATIKDLSGVNTVAGEDIVHWRVRDRFGREHVMEMKAYHIPHASVRLLSPQLVFQSVGGDGMQDNTTSHG
jgi:hypothetical protein